MPKSVYRVSQLLPVLVLALLVGLPIAAAAKAKPTITFFAEPDPAQIGQTVTITVYVWQEDKLPLPTGTITLFDGIDQIGTGPLVADNQNRNKFVVTVKFNTTGSHAIPVAYSGDANYDGVDRLAARKITIDVKKADSTLTVGNVTGARNATVTLTATLKRKHDNAPLAGRTVTFVGHGDAVTDANGVASLDVKIPADKKLGDYTIEAVFDGDGKDNSSKGTGKLTVK